MTLAKSHVHRHGSSTCYVHCKCRCQPCRAGNSERERTRAKQKAYGRWQSPYVPADPIREHVLYLRSAGMGYKTIANRAGVSTTSVRALIYGREDYQNGQHGPRHGEQLKQFGRHKAVKLLALQPTIDNLPQIAPIPARPTISRLQALIAAGHSRQRIADQLGMPESGLSRIITRFEHTAPRHRATIMVRASTALAVEALYPRLADSPPDTSTAGRRGAATRARAEGRRKGWPLPMDWAAYDDDFTRMIGRSVR